MNYALDGLPVHEWQMTCSFQLASMVVAADAEAVQQLVPAFAYDLEGRSLFSVF